MEKLSPILNKVLDGVPGYRDWEAKRRRPDWQGLAEDRYCQDCRDGRHGHREGINLDNVDCICDCGPSEEDDAE